MAKVPHGEGNRARYKKNKEKKFENKLQNNIKEMPA